MHRTFLALVTLTTAFGAGTANAVVIDDFSTDTSSSYTPLLVYNTSPATYSRNANDQFAPTGGGGSTNHFIRNTGEAYGAAGGDSASIDIVSIDNGAAGMSFSASPTASESGFELYVMGTSGGGYNFNQVTPLSGLTFASPATLTVTRRTTDTTQFDYALTGGGLSEPFTGTYTAPAAVAGEPVYFGMMTYNTPGEVLDNLSFTPVPEPASVGALCLAGFGLLARRRRAWTER